MVVETKLSNLLLKLNRLKLMPRTGWLLCGVTPAAAEDVAQHSFEVAAITMFLIEGLSREGGKIDRERALGMAILHDWAEAEVADFPYTARKYLKPTGAKEQMEQAALVDLLRGLPEREKFLELWKEYREGKTTEAKLVHAADYLSIMVQGIRYREQGIRSREIKELWQAVKRDLKPYAKEFKIIDQLAKELNLAFSSPSTF